MTFEKLGLSENILKAINECGYDKPTPIQEQAIPVILMARDVVGVAQTGTGKTASFTLPMIEILAGGRAKARMPRSLILSPTRELAAQIAENFDLYGKHCKLEKALLVGGVSMDEQIKKLDRGVDVLIATPGRLLDLFERGKILLNDIKILVIDEADRMLDMGFIPDIEKISSLVPFTRQTLLFSATMQPEIRKLTQKFLSNPKEISVAPPASTSKNVEQFIVRTSPKNKDVLLADLIDQEKVQNAFIFCNRKRDIDGLTRYLKKRGYNARALHGDMVQKARQETFEAFKAGEVTLLVCSDVAARGLDVQGLSHVFNYDVPFNSDDYVHRIGRTGRAGMTGRAWMLVTSYEDKHLDAIESLTKQKIEEVDFKGSSSKKGAKEDSHKKETSKPKAKGKRNSSKGEESEVIGFGDDIPNFFR
ncbi:MAG: DNA helicase [Micavibrio sp.]|nr:DNA helicase [Micavibrio sp.]|tara:strand:- start:3685 stop:4944 length:1260 start_codon:yes stop_codon:yes gene_type:complete